MSSPDGIQKPPVHARRPLASLALAALTGAGALAVVLAASPPPSTAWQTLIHAQADAGTDPTGPLLAVLALVVWALAGWLVLAGIVVCAGQLPGLAGRVATAVAVHAVPVAVRRTVELALGAGLALGTVGAVPATAQTGAGPGAADPSGTTSLDWPAEPGATGTTTPGTTSTGTTATGTTTGTTTPVSTASGTTAPASAAGPARPAVVVAPGDTLWALAERALQADGDAAPSAAAVAVAWPVWWSANRKVIGADPDLLRPGTPLLAPPPT